MSSNSIKQNERYVIERDGTNRIISIVGQGPNHLDIQIVRDTLGNIKKFTVSKI